MIKRIKRGVRINIYHLCFLIFIPAPAYGQIQIAPAEDCYIFAGGSKADSTYGIKDRDTLITRKSVASNEFTRETYLLFDIGQPDTTFVTVVLKLYGNVLENKKVQVYSTDTSWIEETLTGNTRPPGTFIIEKIIEAGEGYYEWDLTSFINRSLKEGKQRVSFILKDVAGSLSTKDTKWHSKENPSGKSPLLEMTVGSFAVHRRGTYYIDATGGNDDNAADSQSTAWKSLEKLNATEFEPGDSILFKSGGMWEGLLAFSGSGASGKSIIVSSYGTGEKPLLEGNGKVENTVQLSNQQYIELENLHITNQGAAIAFRRAVYITAEDMGPVKNIVLRNLEVSDVNGSMDGEISKNNGGIFLEIKGSVKPTWFDSLLIEGCYIHDVDRTGCSNKSSWSNRTLTANTNWVPSTNVMIRNNVFERTGANALIVRVAHKPAMEYNLFTHCAIKGSGNACFNFNTDSAVWQYNEACFTKYNNGDADAGGFDSDYNTKYTIIQYNYSHDNEYGALLLTGGPASSNGFNDGTIIRYNVLVNNRDHVIRTSGMATNSRIYNNTIITGSSLPGTKLVWHKSWEGYSANTSYYNNIFHTLGAGSSVDLGSSTGNLFDYNIFSGLPVSAVPPDAHKITTDPFFEGTAEINTRFDSCLIYRIRQGSPAINSGKVIPGNAQKDIKGTLVPFYNLPDRGAFEYNGPLSDMAETSPFQFRVFPNPAVSVLRVRMREIPEGKVKTEIYSMEGKLIWKSDFFSTGNMLEFEVPLNNTGYQGGIYIIRAQFSDRTFKHANFSIQ